MIGEGQPMATTKSEEDWQAENDANTLANAEAIRANPEKFERAQKAAKRMLAEEEARAKAMKTIAGAKMNYEKSPKPEV